MKREGGKKGLIMYMSYTGRCIYIYRRYIVVDLELRRYHDRLFIKMILHSHLMIGAINDLKNVRE